MSLGAQALLAGLRWLASLGLPLCSLWQWRARTWSRWCGPWPWSAVCAAEGRRRGCGSGCSATARASSVITPRRRRASPMQQLPLLPSSASSAASWRRCSPSSRRCRRRSRPSHGRQLGLLGCPRRLLPLQRLRPRRRRLRFVQLQVLPVPRLRPRHQLRVPQRLVHGL